MDGKVRGGFLKQQASGGLKKAKSSVEQTAGESHIDNTVLPYVTPPPSYLELHVPLPCPWSGFSNRAHYLTPTT